MDFTRYLLFLMIFFLSCSDVKSLENTTEQEKGIFIDEWTYKVFVGSENNNAKAVFRLWIPENVTPEAVLVLTPGGFGNGTYLVENNDWQEFAKNEKLALLGVHVSSASEEYVEALLLALEIICKERDVLYVSNLPFLLRGFSSGGRFSYVFAANKPNRTIAYANIKGLIWFYDQLSENTSGLIIAGENEGDLRINSLKSVFLSSRRDQKICCFAIEPNSGHIIGKSDQLVRDYFSAILKKKASSGVVMNENNIFLGNIDTFEYAFFSEYLFDTKKASCLIDERFSVQWNNFMEGN